MKHRLFVVLAILVVVSCFLLFGVRGTPSVSASSLAAKTSGTSLRSLAEKQGIDIGAAVQFAPLQNDGDYRSVLAREFNVLVPENEFKFEFVHPTADGYNFSQVDALVDFAKAHNMQVRGHPLLWHYAQPQWLDDGNFTRDELLEIMHRHIQTLVSRYRGQVTAWDVVNEALNRDGSLRDTIWLRNIGPEYIDLAFQWAHETDPQAKLFYSDYGNDEVGRKADAMYTMVSNLVQRGIPIDGVGLQTHKGLAVAPRLDLLSANIARLGKLGLEVQFTELDVKIQDGKGSRQERLAAQARQYGDVLRTCLAYKNCTAFITWGFTDRYTWLGSLTGKEEAPLLFDESYRPKPAYDAIKQVLSSIETATQPKF